MKRNAISAADPRARLLLKKKEVLVLINVGSAKFEEMVDAGLFPQPVWLGTTPNSRRWPFATIERHIKTLTKAADHRAPVHA